MYILQFCLEIHDNGISVILSKIVNVHIVKLLNIL